MPEIEGKKESTWGKLTKIEGGTENLWKQNPTYTNS